MAKEENNRYIRPSLLLLTLITLIVFLCQGWITYKLVNSNITFGVFVVTHLIIVIFIGLITFSIHKRGVYPNLHISLLIQTLFTGVFGSFISLISIVRFSFFVKNSTSFSDWLDSLFPKDDQDKSEKLYERITFGLDDKSGEYVESYRDIMIYGTTLDKQTLIARITRYFSPEFAPILLLALQDTNNIIRVQAAASISKIEDEFFRNYKEREEQMNNTVDNYRVNLKYALFCIEYLESGILGVQRSQVIAEKTIATLKGCIELMKEDESPHFLLGRLLLFMKRAQDAYNVLKPLIKCADFLIPELVKVYISSLYELRKFSELRKFCQDYQNGKINILFLDDELENCINIWGKGITELSWGNK